MRARGEHTRQHDQPRADRREPEELEAGEGDDTGREQDHPRGEQRDAAARRHAEHAGEAWNAEAPRHDGEEREAEAGRGEVVQLGADGEGDEADDREVQARRDHRRAEGPRHHAVGGPGEDGDDDDAVRGQQEAGDDRGGIEDVGGEVVERAELREVQLPPQRIAGGEHGDEHAGDERGDRTTAEVVRAMRRVLPCGEHPGGRYGA